VVGCGDQNDAADGRAIECAGSVARMAVSADEVANDQATHAVADEIDRIRGVEFFPVARHGIGAGIDALVVGVAEFHMPDPRPVQRLLKLRPDAAGFVQSVDQNHFDRSRIGRGGSALHETRFERRRRHLFRKPGAETFLDLDAQCSLRLGVQRRPGRPDREDQHDKQQPAPWFDFALVAVLGLIVRSLRGKRVCHRNSSQFDSPS